VSFFKIVDGLNRLAQGITPIDQGMTFPAANSSLRKSKSGRFQDHFIFGNTNILGQAPRRGPEHFVTRLKVPHVWANRFNLAGQVGAEDVAFWL
jgi:hypothetical protein